MSTDILANLCKFMRETNFDDRSLIIDDSELKSAASSTVNSPRASESDKVICDDCSGIITISENELVCTGCGIIKTIDNCIVPETERVVTYRIKIVGKDGQSYQHDLDKSAPVNPSAIRKQSVLKELMTLNLKFIGKGRLGLPGDALKKAADDFNQLQDHFIKRGINKRQILVSLIYNSCIACGFHRNKAEIADFAELPTNAISKGDTIVRSAIAEGKVDFKIVNDTTSAHVETIFDKISGIIDKAVTPKYKLIIIELLGIAEKYGIIANAQMKSKVSGALIYILECAGKTKDIEQVMAKLDVRANTIKKITLELDEFSEYFEVPLAKLKILT